MYQITLHYVKVEEQENQNQCNNRTDSNNLHRKVTLRTNDVFLNIPFATHLFGSQPYSTPDNAP